MGLNKNCKKNHIKKQGFASYRQALNIPCPGLDLNQQEPKLTRPSTWRVCQFRHPGIGYPTVREVYLEFPKMQPPALRFHSESPHTAHVSTRRRGGQDYGRVAGRLLARDGEADDESGSFASFAVYFNRAAEIVDDSVSDGKPEALVLG